MKRAAEISRAVIADEPKLPSKIRRASRSRHMTPRSEKKWIFFAALNVAVATQMSNSEAKSKQMSARSGPHKRAEAAKSTGRRDGILLNWKSSLERARRTPKKGAEHYRERREHLQAQIDLSSKLMALQSLHRHAPYMVKKAPLRVRILVAISRMRAWSTIYVSANACG